MKKTDKIENHPFSPFLPEGSKIVMCGTFPPKQDKWGMDFFYPNFYNDMWRIFGLIFFKDKEHFFDKVTKTIDKEGIKKMLSEHKIGIGETATQAIRTKDNASDKFLEIITPVDLPALMAQIPDCTAIVTTGEKAASVIAGITATALPKMGERIECEILMKDGKIRKIEHWRMPSTSRAYPMSLEKKKEYYERMLVATGVLG